jgi:hypothetical protein
LSDREKGVPVATFNKSYARKPGAHDRCQTPAYGVIPIVGAIPGHPSNSVIWEPAAGEGYMARALESYGWRVIGTSIETGQDFFDYVPDEPWDVIITNPPYSLKPEWIERCFILGRPWALLLPVTALGNKAVQNALAKYDNVAATFFYPRIDFKMPEKGWDGKGSHFSTFWLSWGFDVSGNLEFYGDISEDKEFWTERIGG